MARTSRIALAFALLTGLLVTPPALAGDQQSKLVDLSVSQTDAPDPVAELGLVAYTVQVRNRAAADHPVNKVIATLSLAGGQLKSASGPRWTCSSPSSDGSSIECAHHGALPPGHQAADLVVSAQAPESGTSMKHSVVVRSEMYADANLLDNVSEERTTVIPAADLAIHQAPQGNPTAGHRFEMLVVVSNGSAKRANDVVVTESVSYGTIAGVRQEDEPGKPSWSCTTGGSQATCTLSHVEGGNDARDLFFQVETPTAASAREMTATATVSSPNDANTANNTAVSEFTVEPNAGQYASVTAYIPPEGGTITSCASTGVTASDTTCAVGIYPPGPGGIAQLIEGDEIEVCNAPGTQCDGQSVAFFAPDGYTDSDNLITWIQYTNNTDIDHPFWIKQPACQEVPGAPCDPSAHPEKPAPDCSLGEPLGDARPLPCLESMELVDSDGDGEIDDSKVVLKVRSRVAPAAATVRAAVENTIGIEPPIGRH